MDVKHMAILGLDEAVLAYRALGMISVVLDEPSGLDEAVEILIKDGVAVIFIMDDLAAKRADVFESYQEALLPALIPVPGGRLKESFGLERLRNMVRKAVGIDLMAQ